MNLTFRFKRGTLALLALLHALAGIPAAAQGGQEGPTGTVVGELIDGVTGALVGGVAILLVSEEASGTPPIGSFTDLEGKFRADDVPTGAYTVRLFKAGYEPIAIAGLRVERGQTARVNYPLVPLGADPSELRQPSPETAQRREAERADPPPAGGTGMDVFELDVFTITAEEMTEMSALFFDLRRDRVGTVDFLSREDFSRFALGDLSAAVEKMPGVNVVEGKFAVVRGMSDRFNSTLVNGLPVPSPDPLRQGMQLDLFPTSIIESVVAQKSFVAQSPGNSSGAAFELGTRRFPEEREAWFKAGFRFNTEAQRQFLRDPEHGTSDYFAVGKGDRGPLAQPSGSFTTVPKPFLGEEADPPLGLTFGAGFGDTTRLWGRKLGYIISLSYDSTARTQTGSSQAWYGQTSRAGQVPPGFPAHLPNRWRDEFRGSLFTGELRPAGFHEYTRSTFSVLLGGLASLTYDLDPKGMHRLSAVLLVSQAADDEVRRLSEGFLPEGGIQVHPYANNRNTILIGVGGANNLGYYYNENVAYEERNLTVGQLLGTHRFEDLGDLEVSWGVSYGATTSDLPRRIESHYMRYTDEFQSGVEVGFGFEAGNDGVGEMLQEIALAIEQDQIGARLDAEYPVRFFGRAGGELRLGIYHDSAERDVAGQSQIVEASGARGIRAESPQALSEAAVALGDGAGARMVGPYPTTAEVTQDINAAYLAATLPLTGKVDLTLGLRFEEVELTARGDARVVGSQLGTDGFTIERLLLDSRRQRDGSQLQNATIIGWLDPSDPASGFTERRWHPSLSLQYEPIDNLTMRMSYGETAARPSFREVSPYFDREAATGELVLGNPYLKPAEVKNADWRLEYVSDNADVVALSLFYKEVLNPIEGAFFVSSAQNGPDFRTFFNNQTTALVKGIEVEFRRSLDSLHDSLKGFSVGMNYSRIQAEVSVPPFFPESYFNFAFTLAGDVLRSVGGAFVGDEGPVFGIDPARLQRTRRLADQPEWLLNADLSYTNENLGLTATLALYAQSSVLSGVGVGSPINSRNVIDQYTVGFEELNLIVSQELRWLSDSAVLRLAVTNLTDSSRGIEYDEAIAFADDYQRLTYRVGQSYRLALEIAF
jgi:hypothetical protein